MSRRAQSALNAMPRRALKSALALFVFVLFLVVFLCFTCLSVPNLTRVSWLAIVACNRACRPPPGPAPGPPHPSPSPPGPATVQIDTATVVHVVDERYVSFNLDGSYNRGWFQRDLANAKLRFLTAQLSPAVLRHGGSGNDYFDYDVPTATSPATTAPACLPGKSYPALPGTSRCPPWSDSKICAASVAKPGFCESAATGPEPNCCTECHHAWNSTSYPWPHGGV